MIVNFQGNLKKEQRPVRLGASLKLLIFFVLTKDCDMFPQLAERSRLKVPLPWMLILPFIIQVTAVVTVVGYLAHRNGQESVADLTEQLMDGATSRVNEKLVGYLASPTLVNQAMSDTIAQNLITLDLERPNPKIDRYLLDQMRLYPNLAWISLGTEKGSNVGIWRPGENRPLQIAMANAENQYFGTYYATNDQGRTQKLKVEKPAFKVKTRPWYQQAVAAKQPIWTNIYPGFTAGTIFLAGSQPLYDPQGKLAGVIGTDISLTNIQDFLSRNRVSPGSETFVVERSGLLVASSGREPTFDVPANQEPARLSMLQSKTPLIKATAEALNRRSVALPQLQSHRFQFSRDRQNYLVQVRPFKLNGGLDWLIVVVVPEADVMARIKSGTSNTFLLCLSALVAVSLLNILISRWLIKPITAISRASQNITQGDFSRRLIEPRIRELAVLSNSFNHMSEEIERSRSQLEEYSRSLEQKVSDRTQELQAEIQNRQAAEEALKEANAALHRMAYIDALTQIPNRRRFDEVLQQSWRQGFRDRQPISAILCDVDFFKRYNDCYGHQEGDRCLQLVASAISLVVRRPNDLAARYGGEEFVVILPQTPIEGAMEVAQMIQANVRALQIPHAKSDIGDYVTLSLGVSCLVPEDVMKPEILLSQADEALYLAKEKGRDRII
jgi:diguanylate cyclase (GGDEF)-like protein